MAVVTQFDLLNSSLAGTNLIEASAGTGKTYAITGLFLRLLLEKDLPVDQILVVTFTEAATGELKERIRTALREALKAVSAGQSEDSFLSVLIARQKDSAVSLRRLREALRAFDQAGIFTIHGFCLRILREHAFESGALFDTELITEQEHIQREIVEDFWRQHFYDASPLFVQYCVHNKVKPNSFIGLVGTQVTRPYLNIIPSATPVETSGLEDAYRRCFQEVRESWQQERINIERTLTDCDGLNRSKYRKDAIPILVSRMDQFLAWGDGSPTLFKGFEKFTSSELVRSVKKDHEPPEHPFFGLCEDLKVKQQDLETAFEQRLIGLKSELLQFAGDELAGRKEKQNVQSFDDLLIKVRQALSGAGVATLARAIRSKFKAALIDEFQDTDPIQYEIFRSIFGEGKSSLFLIGDPKQAIYGFRGADIFAYLDAAAHVERRYTLSENWRSEPDLIHAVNTLFAHADRPFVYEAIDFHAAKPADGNEQECLQVDGEPEQPLHLWFVDSDTVAAPGKAVTKGQARDLISRSVAVEISRLLNLSRKGKALLGTRPVRESDIAVLVRKNTEARIMQQALSELNIPSVLHSTESLFASHEALELERVLAALSEPGNEKVLRSALATDMMGCSGEDLAFLLEDDTGWDTWIVRFRNYHSLWEKRGFIVMFRRLLSELGVLPRLISLSNGERRTTNVLHLSEVLHRASIDGKLGMSSLVKWLSEKRAGEETQGAVEHQLRLETDETAVGLVTIHRSKGLEYPIVFCPFAWDGSRVRNSTAPLLFHDDDTTMQPTLDLGSPEKEGRHRALAEKELLAENLRLLYVGLSRAKNRCYLVWGRFNDGETSAPAYLFHLRGGTEGKSLVEATAERFERLSNREILEEMTELQEKSTGTISLSAMPMGPGESHQLAPGEKMHLGCRKFSGNIDREWHVSSFSGLVSGTPHRHGGEDRDGSVISGLHQPGSFEAEEAVAEPAGIFSFPRGTKAGTFFHDLFEHFDFTAIDRMQTERLVIDKLREYGFDVGWKETLCEMIGRVVTVPLQPGKKDFCLREVRDRDRINELEFYFPLKSMTSKQLKQLFADHAGPDIGSKFPRWMERLDFSPVKGFMKGFIDMVFHFQGRFYLVDWKSNFLGSDVQDYDQGKLAEVMCEEFYVLQYHIYCLALHQYLRARLPNYAYEHHFGGVYYIFLRGVDPARGPEYGVYRDKPASALITALAENLAAEGNRGIA
jgi:exodeoxyribonuclease V beta subunit